MNDDEKRVYEAVYAVASSAVNRVIGDLEDLGVIADGSISEDALQDIKRAAIRASIATWDVADFAPKR